MMIDFEFPEFDEKDYPQICFIKKSRIKGKTTYTFLKASIEKEISKTFRGWFTENIRKAEERKIDTYNPSISSDSIEWIDLNSVNNWDLFLEKAFCINEDETERSNRSIASLDEVKRHLIGFIIYIKKDKSIYGQIRKRSPSNVLNKSGIYNIYFGNSVFNEMKEEKGFQVDEFADLIFEVSDESSYAIIYNKSNFKDIFDMREQEKRDALEVISKVSLFTKNKVVYEKIMIIVEDDRNLQKMLINPSFSEYFEEVDFSVLNELKNEVSNGVNFEIDVTNQDLILPVGKEKEAVKDIIKSVTGRYKRSLNRKHIVESGNVKRVLK